MQEKFTQKAGKALALAGKAAGQLHQNYIGTEHILLGLIRENTGVAAQVLLENGVDAKEVLEIIKDLIAPQTNLLEKEKNGYVAKSLEI